MESQTKTCKRCGSEFTLKPEDFTVYEKHEVPPPTWCPACRLQRRLLWRNEWAFYKRTCDLCKKEILAMYPPDAPHPVYCRPCWYSDKWDASQYAQDYDFSRPFFEQFRELLNKVPQIAIQVSNSVNCDYANQIANCKNCYLITSGSDNEDCMYSFRILNCKNVLDSFVTVQSQLSYECKQCLESSRLKFAEECTDSVDCSFVYDVRGSQNCFMSSNLRRSSYVFRNEQLSKEEYKKRMEEIDTGSYRKLREYKEEFEELLKSSVRRFALEKNTVDCSGNGITNSKNSKHCFHINNLEDSSYCYMVNDAKDSHDINNGCCIMEKNYEVSTTGAHSYDIRLSADIWPEARNVTYSQSCRDDVENLFGCVALRKKKYCILNKEYSKEEYEELLPKIKAHMDEMPYKDKKGRTYPFGEFFPPELSLFSYNDSSAQDFFPLDKGRAEAKGFLWRGQEKNIHKPTVMPEDLPDHIRDADESILKEIVGCEHEGKCNHRCTGAFRITPAEFAFYKDRNIALPRLCPNCRHYERLRTRNPYYLWRRKCMCRGSASEGEKYKNKQEHSHGKNPCPNEFETSYEPGKEHVVYCDNCYKEEVS